MIDFILKNYYVILVVSILLIFAIIGYLVDTLKTRKYEEENLEHTSYIPEEEIFIKQFDEKEDEIEENPADNLDEMLKEYNSKKNKTLK